MIALFYPLISNTAIKRTCEMLVDINTGNWNQVNNLKYQLDESLETYLQSCLNKNVQINYEEAVLKNNTFDLYNVDQLKKLLDGISAHSLFQNKYENQENPKSIFYYK